MIRAGFTITNPLTQSRTIVLKSDAETDGMGWLLEVHCAPGACADIAEHLHTEWIERFEIISGTAYYALGGQQHMLEAGGSFTVLPGQRHIHPWSAVDSPMVYRQANDFGRRSPEAVQEVLGVFATVAGLARDGKVDQAGRPKHPLQLAAMLRTLNRHGGYDVRLPIPVQNILSATLGRLAGAMGYHGVYERFVRS
jgi:hypothetical protein